MVGNTITSPTTPPPLAFLVLQGKPELESSNNTTTIFTISETPTSPKVYKKPYIGNHYHIQMEKNDIFLPDFMKQLHTYFPLMSHTIVDDEWKQICCFFLQTKLNNGPLPSSYLYSFLKLWYPK